LSQTVTNPSAADFDQLKAIVDSLSSGTYSPTAAAVKTALLKLNPSFDERKLGFRRFVDFIQAAVDRGAVSMIRDANNHPRVFPVDARPNVLSNSPPFAMEGLRLRREVWRALVDWTPADYWRGWDRQQSRVFMAPHAGSSTAPWEVDPTRFLPLPIISQEEQVAWMKEFAAAQVPLVRDKLESGLSPDSELGAFRVALRDEGLAEAWSVALRQHVNLRAAEWATSAKVARHYLFESQLSNPRDIHVDAKVAKTAGDAGPQTAQSVDENASEKDDALRQKLHRVIDGMVLGELAALPIPARFLVIG